MRESIADAAVGHGGDGAMNFPFDTIYEATMKLLPAAMNTPQAKAMLIAIGLQESRFTSRRQLGDGPARGFWQFERGGGTHGVLTHKATAQMAANICRQRGVPATAMDVWTAFETDDVLACCFARLLLYTAPWPLPGPDEHEEGWRQYEWCWRPGHPHRETWDELYTQAWQMVNE